MHQPLQLLRRQADDRGHGAGIFLGLPVHEAAALAHRRQGIAGAQHPGGIQGAVFPQAVAAHRRRRNPGFGQGPVETEVDHRDRGLEVHRQGEFLHGAGETEPFERQAGGLLRQVEQIPGPGVGVKEVLAHAHVLGTLPGKQKRDARHVHLKKGIRIIFRYNSSEPNCNMANAADWSRTDQIVAAKNAMG